MTATETAAITDLAGIVMKAGAVDGDIYIDICVSSSITLSIDETDELISGLRKAQLIAAEQRGRQTLADLRGRQHYQPRHADV